MSSETSRPKPEGEPTLAQIMRRPRWIAALLVALIVAAAFAWLGRWQLEHAVTTEAEKPGETETVQPIDDVTGPGESVTDRAAGMVFSVEGQLVDGDYLVVDQRANGGEVGAWVTAHLETVDGQGNTGHLPVAIGWAPTVEQAARAAQAIQSDPDLTSGTLSLEGRYMPSDAAVIPKPNEDPFQLVTMVPGQLVNLWQPFDGPSFAGYLVSHPSGSLSTASLAELGLDAIDSVPPLPMESINWLNLFYAAEWVVFAGFALFFWFRLVRDDWEKQHELKLLQGAGE